MNDNPTLRTAWRRTALICVVLACVLPPAARLVAGPKGADIHVEFQPDGDAATRERVAARYRLINPRKLEDTYTWRYELTDPSRANIEAIVRDPAINDTHEVDRNSFTLSPTAPRTSRRQRFAAGGDTMVGIADSLALVLIAVAALAAVTRTAPSLLFQRGIPEVDAATAGLFRIVFGVVVLAFFATHPVDASWLAATFDLEIEGRLQAALLEWLRGHPAVVNLITPWILTMGIAFTVGLLTRLTFTLFVAGALLWAYVAMSLDSTHPHASFVLGLVVLLPSRWGDALSVDAWLRRRRGRDSAVQPAGRHYGYTVWVPGLVFGVGYAAAAWAKLSIPPGWTDWILNGTVKYHFITDSNLAPFGWGLQLAHYPRIAIVASLFALATEALAVTAAFVRHEMYRFGMGLASVALVGGFYVFMGHFWPGWWILILGFLPWRRLGLVLGRLNPAPTGAPINSTYDPINSAYVEAGFSRPGLRTASAVQVAAIIFVIAQQAIFSTLTLERAPMFSYYPMYAVTYASPAAYEASRPPRYRIMATTDRGKTPLGCSPHEEFVRQFQAAVEGSEEAKAGVWTALRGCGENLDTVRDVTLEGEARTFDWDRLVFVTRAAPAIGPLQAEVIGSPVSY